MDQYDIRLIIVVIFLVFGSALFGIIRKLKNKIIKPSAPAFSLTVTVQEQEPVVFENQVLVLPAHVITGARDAHKEIETIPITKKAYQRTIDVEEQSQDVQALIREHEAWEKSKKKKKGKRS